MQIVLVIPPSGRETAERRIPLAARSLEIGGAADCDAIVDDPSVGAGRLSLELQNGEWVAIDREGRGLCSAGGVPLRPRVPRIVRPPHALRLGEVEMRLLLDFDGGDADAEAAPHPTREVAFRAVANLFDVAPLRPRVRVVEGPRRGELLELTGGERLRIGRGAGCELLLDTEEGSREHAAIEWRAEARRVLVLDLGSAGGTFLGRSRLVAHRAALWSPLRMLRIADTVLSLEMATNDGVAEVFGEAPAPQPAISPAVDAPLARPAAEESTTDTDVAAPVSDASSAAIASLPKADPPIGPGAARRNEIRTARTASVLLLAIVAVVALAAIVVVVVVLVA